jgi:hypothetical protein
VPDDVAERRFVLGIAYPALRKDGHGEWMTADTVEATAWEFLRSGRQIGVFHADGTVGHADVVESYVHRGPAYSVTAPDGTAVTINPGDWVLGAVFDDQLWSLLKRGELDGWSIDGTGRRRRASLPTPQENAA